MSRRRKVLASLVGFSMVAGAAYAVPTLLLRVKATVTPLAALQWNTAAATVSNDTGTLNDPGGAAPYLEGPTRETYHVGSTALPTFVAGVLTTSLNDAYQGYRSVIRASHADSRAGWKIQSVGLVVPDPALKVGLNPAHCGKSLDMADKEVAVGFLVGPITAQLVADIEVRVVPAGLYVAASCNSWDAL